MEVFGFAATVAMGVTLGLTGSGGSILTVPILVYLFGLPPSIATGNSLFIVGTTALIGSSLALPRGDIDFRSVLAFALPSAVGVNISRGLIIPQIPTTIAHIGHVTVTKEFLIMVAFAGIMILASWSMIHARQEVQPAQQTPNSPVAIVGTMGLIVGIIAGFVGAGGGFLVIPVLVLMAGLRMKVAVGTSLTIVAMQSLVGFWGDVSRGFEVDWTFLGSTTSAAIVGILGGSAIARRMPERNLKTAFGWFVLATGITILGEQFWRLFSE